MRYDLAAAGSRSGRRFMAVVTATATVAVAAASVPAPASAGAVRGLPRGVAAAALDREPSLPLPHGWTFPDAFSRTSGTGRMIGGAFEWTDWVYDGYGASSPQGASLNSITSNADSLSPAHGDFVYPAGASDNDGADIFRAAVGLTPGATVWRVDWNTLADPSIPIAEWTFDTDANARTGAAAWPAAANVSSPGIEKALVVSAKGAELIDAVTGATIATLPTVVDRSSQSFLVRIPRSVMPVSGLWRVRLAAGLADAAGTGFAIPTLSGGIPASPSAPRVYNITFRTTAQEPAVYATAQTDSQIGQLGSLLGGTPILGAYGAQGATIAVKGNFWAENDQADTLESGDVSKFSQLVDWAALAAHSRTSPPLVRGWSDRWYATDLHLGQGVSGASEANPAFLGRVQPYAVYVPTNYTGKRALPLSWTLHSASVNYNQYAVINPRLVEEECQARDSICASPEGFGGNGLYQGDAEHDFWQVWRQVALAYKVLPNRTLMSGYSMGGLGSFVLPTTYPSDFSESMPLDGGFDAGCTSAPFGAAQEDIAAAADRTRNVQWVPFVISDSYTDELSPYPDELVGVNRYENAADRFTFFSTTAPEHVTTDTLDGFSTQVAALHGTPAAVAAPGTIDYTWCPGVIDHRLGLGPTSLYWLSGLAEAPASSPAGTATILADDRAIPEPAEAEQLNASVATPADAPPMQVLSGTWNRGATPRRIRALSLELDNVAGVTIDTSAAKLPQGRAVARSNDRVRLTLTRLARNTVVREPGRISVVGRSGRITAVLAPGTSVITWSLPRTAGSRCTRAGERKCALHSGRSGRQNGAGSAGRPRRRQATDPAATSRADRAA